MNLKLLKSIKHFLTSTVTIEKHILEEKLPKQTELKNEDICVLGYDLNNSLSKENYILTKKKEGKK